ncbi:hypothetical protein [Devosia sp. 63-57]|uniref:helix-turn-helix domain-containing protein n=1 Tax=Devosia sp. 63-57 TaxID=1895751 RepID=UPI00086A9BD1|nr:hypothetical protein [Devosia sp. 63-57]ODT47080.1 MAG: hypothetical protein ABS74_12250 [Pelagibacterium sp. SCN 63-126]OJX43209.1 MAG: hypothetical protein BGO80_17620 [Devosia sp. 63-57]
MSITPEQIRAARAVTRMEQGELAQRAGVSLGTVKRLEGVEGTANAQEATIASVRKALEEAGVSFIADGEPSPIGGVGIRFTEPAPAKLADNVQTILDALVASLESVAERRGMQGHEMQEAIEEAKEEAYKLLVEEGFHRNLRRISSPSALPDGSRSVQLLRKYLSGELTPPPDDESE